MDSWGSHEGPYNGRPSWWGGGPPPWVTARPSWSSIPGSDKFATPIAGNPTTPENEPKPTMPTKAIDLAVVVDDADTRIRYQGSWDSETSVGNWYQQSRHRSTPSEQRSNLSFSFKGHWVELHGQHPIGSQAEVNCSISPTEGTEHLVGPWEYGPSNGSSTDILPCTWTRLSPAVLYTVNLWVEHPPSAAEDAFGLDYILFGPLELGLRAGDIVRYHRQQHQIGFTGAVDTRTDWRYTILGNGGGFNFTFYGNSATPFLYLPPTTGSNKIYGAYESNTNGLQPIAAPDKKGAYVPLHVDIQDARTIGDHRLEVVYRPSNESAMYLDFIEVPYQPLGSYPTPPTPTPTSLSPPSQNANGMAKGTIAGATVGAVLGLAVILVLVWWFFRRRRHQGEARLQAITAHPFIPTPNGPELASPIASDEQGQDEEKGGYGGDGSNPLGSRIQPQEFAQGSPPSPGNGREGRASDASYRPRRFLVHTDSGLRLPRARRSELVEVPPEYTVR